MECGVQPDSAFLKCLTPEVADYCFAFLDPGAIKAVELSSKTLNACVREKKLWKRTFEHKAKKDGWRVPEEEPGVGWKAFLSRYEKELSVKTNKRIKEASMVTFWRTIAQQGRSRKKSRVFPFAHDAVGDDIQWQMELETNNEVGYLRIWTTNPWTLTTTCHYFGSHCTISLRDSCNTIDITPETYIDIDNNESFVFAIPHHREVVVKVTLTLALEIDAPLHQFYRFVSRCNSADTDLVKMGYCKSIFEIAKYKRKHTGTFIRPIDRDISPLIDAILSPSTSFLLRVEIFQALFNLLGPTSTLLDSGVVVRLLKCCERQMLTACGNTGEELTGDVLVLDVQLAQNVLGNVFNLLTHQVTKDFLSQSSVSVSISSLLSSAPYQICHFSSLVILLTMRAWGTLPPSLSPLVIHTLAAFMESTNPVNFETTGVAWDESDIASFFIPLLCSGDRICVAFVSWCLGHFYFSSGGGSGSLR